ncbi:flagellar biosynthetic protein FliO [Salimicrobium salexigens]|uniref:flagellar biosynthetic protein FliO n=1 Tax=Salimicrobium salexigens TaxID=908941 RepID=UPI0003000866|nr:flagellar biosynthetic protein FliO [Salimicrobium salexigens]
MSECAKNPGIDGCSEEGGESKEENEEQPAAEPLWWSATKLILALVFVLGLIYGVLKFIQKKNNLFSNTRQMHNLGGVPLGQNRSVQAVKIGGHVYIIGVGDTVEMLTEITDEETRKQLLNGESDLSGDNENSGKQFHQLFDKQLSLMKENRMRNGRGKDHTDE